VSTASMVHVNAFPTCLVTKETVYGWYTAYVGACRMQWLYCGKLESGQAAFIE